MFLLEKQHLHPVSSLLSKESTIGSSISRNVNKDNTIRFESNRYSVPIGTYKANGDNKVFIEITGLNQDTLIIRNSKNDEFLAKHVVSKEKGILVKNRSHSRDCSKGIEVLKSSIVAAFESEEHANEYIDEVLNRYPRYRRDQLEILRSMA